MSTALATINAATMENVLISGDLSKLTSEQRTSYYKAVCDSVGLNPLTKPFDYINLNGKLTLYAKRDCTDQLRSIHDVSVAIVSRENHDGLYVVTARATTPDGRTDESIGAVAIANLKGDALANACMKAETKAKRRVTLSICGLGWLDETEIETVPHANPHVEHSAALPPPSNGTNGHHATERAPVADTPAVELLKKLGWGRDKIVAYLRAEFGVSRLSELNPVQCLELVVKLDGELERQQNPRISAEQANELDKAFAFNNYNIERAAVLLREFGAETLDDLAADQFDAVMRRVEGEPVTA